MRSCRVEGHSQIDLKGLKNDKIRDHIAGDSARGRSKPRKVGSTIIKILHHWFVSNRVLGVCDEVPRRYKGSNIHQIWSNLKVNRISGQGKNILYI